MSRTSIGVCILAFMALERSSSVLSDYVGLQATTVNYIHAGLALLVLAMCVGVF